MERDHPIFFLIAPCRAGGDHEKFIFESIIPPPLGSMPQQGKVVTDPCPHCGRVFAADLNITLDQQGWAAIGPVIRMVVP